MASQANPLAAFLRHGRFLRQLRRTLTFHSPDIVIAFMNRNNVQTLLAAPKGMPVVVSERNYPPANPLGPLWEWLRRRTYTKAVKLVSLSKGTDACFSWLPNAKRAVIYNPVPESAKAGPRPSIMRRARHYFLAAGRLHRIKDFPNLIRAFALIHKQFPEWDLVVLGEGEERPHLESMIAQERLTDRVLLPGRVENIADFLREADVFVLSSTSEGLSNVIIEAQYQGTPVVATDCPTGPGEIITSGHNGLLVPVGDSQKLSNQMARLAGSSEVRERLASRAIETVRAFSENRIFGQWESLITQVVSESNRPE